MPPESNDSSTDEVAGADYDPADNDRPYTPDNHESTEIADVPEFVGYMPDPDNVVEGYGDPQQGDLPPVAQDVSVVTPVRNVPMACDRMVTQTVVVQPASAGDGRPVLLIGYQPDRQSVTVVNVNGGPLLFDMQKEVGPASGQLPVGLSFAANYRGPIYAQAATTPVTVSIIAIFAS